MKQTHNNYYQEQAEIERISELLEARKQFEEKTRINLYLPKIIVKLIDRLAKDVSRGELVTALVIKELKKKEKLPFGMFSPIEISEEEINDLSSSWNKTINELA